MSVYRIKKIFSNLSSSIQYNAPSQKAKHLDMQNTKYYCVMVLFNRTALCISLTIGERGKGRGIWKFSWEQNLALRYRVQVLLQPRSGCKDPFNERNYHINALQEMLLI